MDGEEVRIAKYHDCYLVESEGKTLFIDSEFDTVSDKVNPIGANPNDVIIYDDTEPEPLKVPDNPAEGTRVISALEGSTYVSVFVDGKWYTESWKGIDKAFPAHNYLYDVPTEFYADEEILEILEPFAPGKITRQWAVGDTVPAWTAVGKTWLGRSADDLSIINPEGKSLFTRTIEWIES